MRIWKEREGSRVSRRKRWWRSSVWARAGSGIPPSGTPGPSTRRSVAALFVDTGAFYAAADRSDAHHDDAAAVFKARAAGGLITTDHVVVETWLLLRARLGREAAMKFWDAMESGLVKVIGVTS